MAVFFNGRLWITPATMSLVDDSQMYNRNPNVGNVLAILGPAGGGKPFEPVKFGSYAEAAKLLISGESLKAIEKAFDPSSQTFGPSKILFIRTNDETQSALDLKDDAGNVVINLTSTGFGKINNSIRVMVTNGTRRGKRVYTRIGSVTQNGNNIARDCLNVQYVGNATSATVTVTSTKVILKKGGAIAESFDLVDIATIQELSDRINAVDGFVSLVLENSGQLAAINRLDGVTDVSVKTDSPVALTGNLQAIVDWFNGQGEPLVNAVRADGALAAPANISYTYLRGASDGLVTMNEWANAFEALQGEDVQWVCPISSDPAIHAMADSHCAYMSNIARMERRAICGTALGTSDDAAIKAAKNINSDRTSLVHLGFYDYDSAGKLTLFPPYILAAQLAGMFSGVNPGTALSNKTIKIRGLERKLRNPTDTDDLIEGGLLCVEDTPKGFKVIKSITTWLANDNYNRVEISTGVALDYVSRAVRETLDALRGEKGGPQKIAEAISRVDSTLRELARPEPMGIGVIVGDKANPAYRNITASLEGDVLRVEFECSPVIPINYIPIVIHAVPYSGSASL
ncbi:MAG: hypothetical protein ACMV0I_06755 [Pseudomonas sp.]